MCNLEWKSTTSKLKNVQELIYSKLHEKNHLWLLVNNIQVTISVMLQYFTRQMEETSYFNFIGWKFDVNSNVKIHSLTPNHVWKLSSFFNCEKQSLLMVELNNLTTKQRKNSLACSLDATFLPNVFWVFEKLFNPVQVALTKIQRNEAKIYQKMDFLINLSWLLPDVSFFIGHCTGQIYLLKLLPHFVGEWPL